jgi:extradiol dioxygenase family protein
MDLLIPRPCAASLHSRHLAAVQTRLRPRSCAAHAAHAFELASTPEQDAAARASAAFHLAIPVHDLALARSFYGAALGCAEGRCSLRWVDFNFFGHQLVCHLVDGAPTTVARNVVDGDPVPVPHFGLALTVAAFHSLTGRLADAGYRFEIEPHVRFRSQPGEQWCAFLFDPSGNALEIKAMTAPENLFARYTVL